MLCVYSHGVYIITSLFFLSVYLELFALVLLNSFSAHNKVKKFMVDNLQNVLLLSN